MQRRSFFSAAAGAGFAGSAAAAPDDKRGIIELSYLWLRNNEHQQPQRTRDFLSNAIAPALKRAGSGPVGLFSNLMGMRSPSYFVVNQYESLAARDEVAAALQADKEVNEAARDYYSNSEPGFERIEKSLLRGFRTMPKIEAPPTEEGRPARVFELRVYESDTPVTLARKIGMFDDGEIEIFRKTGLLPVFFGETIIGPKMPNLTYMIAFDNWAAREKNWSTFVNHPDWKELRARPGLADAEIVSNITNTLLRPLPASDIR